MAKYGWFVFAGYLALVGCGTGVVDRSGETGRFLDSAVSGLNFRTAGYQGVTDESGRFRFHQGESIAFSIGDIAIGQTQAKSLITPRDLFPDAVKVTDPRISNLLRLLQTLDTDQNLENGIALPANLSAHTSGLTIDFALSPQAFEQQDSVQQILHNLSENKTLVSEGAAQVHFQNVLREIDAKAPLYSISVTVEKLNGTVVIGNHSQDALTISSNGTHAFAKKYFDETNYYINVIQNPVDQTCWVIDGVGEVNGKDVDNVTITCGSKQQNFNGQVSGLRAGYTFEIGYGNSRALIDKVGPYTLLFDTQYPNPTPVSVVKQPTGQYCEVLETASKNTNERDIACHNLFRLTGTITGARVGTITVNYHIGEESKSSVIASGSSEIVFDDNAVASRLFKIDSIVSNTNREVCTWTGDNFTVTGLVDSIKINCVPKTYTVSLNVTGMASGRGDVKVGAIVGGASVVVPPISQNKIVVIKSQVAYGTNTSLSIGANDKPVSQTCTFDKASAVVDADDLIINLVCKEDKHTINIVYTSSTNNPATRGAVVLSTTKMGDILAPITLSAGTTPTSQPYIVTTEAVYGEQYTFNVTQDDISQICSVPNTTYTVGAINITVPLSCSNQTFSVTVQANFKNSMTHVKSGVTRNTKVNVNANYTNISGGGVTIPYNGTEQTQDVTSDSVNDVSRTSTFSGIVGGSNLTLSKTDTAVACTVGQLPQPITSDTTIILTCDRLTPINSLSTNEMNTTFANCITNRGFTNTREITTLDCSNRSLTSITGAEWLDNLTSINVSGNGNLNDLSPLRDLTELTSVTMTGVTLANPAIDDLWLTSNIPDTNLRTCIQTERNLRYLTNASDFLQLRCPNASITDLTGLEKLRSLQLIDLSGNTGITDIKWIGYLTIAPKVTNLQSSMKQLHINGLNALTNITPIDRLRNLIYLDARNTSTSFSNGNLPSLTTTLRLSTNDPFNSPTFPAVANSQLKTIDQTDYTVPDATSSGGVVTYGRKVVHLMFSGTGRVINGELKLGFNISHSSIFTFTVNLIDPSGRTVVLAPYSSLSAITTSGNAALYPDDLSGDVLAGFPSISFSSLYQTNTNVFDGVWTLVVEDRIVSSSSVADGILRQWGISLGTTSDGMLTKNASNQLQ